MNKSSARLQLIAAMSGAAALALVTSAVAQSGAFAVAKTSTPSEESSLAQATIVVTARLRQEDAQNVPISLSVVDAQQDCTNTRMRGALAAGTAAALKEFRHAGVCVELRERTVLVEPARNRAFCEQVHSNNLGK
jgi:hypothetical protein